MRNLSQNRLELVARREEHLRNVQRALVQPLEAYLRSLEPLKQQFAREGKAQPAAFIEREIAKIRKELEQARAAASNRGIMRLKIESAMFGDVKSKRLLDITKYVQKALDAGWDSVSLRGDAMGNSIDPAPFVSKTVTITYTLGGKRAEKSFADGAILRFATDLQ